MPQHTIVAGDTFWALSQKYGVPLDSILAANCGVKPEQLQIGQVVCVPSGRGMMLSSVSLYLDCFLDWNMILISNSMESSFFGKFTV